MTPSGYPDASADARGIMSAAHFAKLDELMSAAAQEARFAAIESDVDAAQAAITTLQGQAHAAVTLDGGSSSWLTLVGQALKLTLVAAANGVAGVVTAVAQDFTGVKTFLNGLIASAAVTINSYLVVTGAPSGANLTDGQHAYLGSYNNNIGSAALWLAVTPSTTNYAVAVSTSGGLGTPVGTTLAGSPAIVMGRNGTGASDVCTKTGTSTEDASVNAGAKLASWRTGLGGTEVEKMFVLKDGTIGMANGVYVGEWVNGRAGFAYLSAGAALGMFNANGAIFLGVNLGTGLASCNGSFQAGADSFVGRYLQLNTTGTARPTANSTNRGMVWYSKSAGGSADTLQVCLKSAGDTYSWVTIATG